MAIRARLKPTYPRGITAVSPLASTIVNGKHRLTVDTAAVLDGATFETADITDFTTATDARITAKTNNGLVNIVRTANGSNDPSVLATTWQGRKVDGSTISSTGTTTGSAQEYINYCHENAYDILWHGGGIKPEKINVDYGGNCPNNPIATTNLSATITVTTSAAHNLSVGNRVMLYGVGSAVGGISAANLMTQMTVASVPTSTTYTAVAPTTATSTVAAGGGSGIQWNQAGQDVSMINATAAVTFPPLQGVNWIFNPTWNFGGAGGAAAITIDSIMASEFRLNNQVVVTSGYTAGVLVKPTKQLPQDPYGPVITSSSLYIPSVVPLGTLDNCIEFDLSNGSIKDNIINIKEPNNSGGVTGAGVVITNPTASTAFRGNFVTIAGAHSSSSHCVRIGTSSTNAASISQNEFRISCNPAAGATGIEVWGNDNVIIATVTDDLGMPGKGVHIKPGASRNTIIAMGIEGTIPIHDEGTGTILLTANGLGPGAIIQMPAKTMWGNPTSSTDNMDAMTRAEVAEIVAHAQGAGKDIGATNVRLASSRSGSAETLSVKTDAGTDASTSDPITMVFPDGSGGVVSRAVTAALSLTIPSTATMGVVSNVPFVLWLVAFDDAGTVRLGVIKATSANSVTRLAPFGTRSSTLLDTASDSTGVFYTGTAVTSKRYIVLGSFEYAGLATPGTWNVAPTAELWRPGMPLAGEQVAISESWLGSVATGTTTCPLDDTIPQNTEKTDYTTASIAPGSAANLLVIDARIALQSGTGTIFPITGLWQDSTANALVAQRGYASDTLWRDSLDLHHMMVANTTSSTTFKLGYAPHSAATLTVNGSGGARELGGVQTSGLTIRELRG